MFLYVKCITLFMVKSRVVTFRSSVDVDVVLDKFVRKGCFDDSSHLIRFCLLFFDHYCVEVDESFVENLMEECKRV